MESFSKCLCFKPVVFALALLTLSHENLYAQFHKTDAEIEKMFELEESSAPARTKRQELLSVVTDSVGEWARKTLSTQAAFERFAPEMDLFFREVSRSRSAEEFSELLSQLDMKKLSPRSQYWLLMNAPTQALVQKHRSDLPLGGHAESIWTLLIEAQVDPALFSKADFWKKIAKQMEGAKDDEAEALIDSLVSHELSSKDFELSNEASFLREEVLSKLFQPSLYERSRSKLLEHLQAQSKKLPKVSVALLSEIKKGASFEKSSGHYRDQAILSFASLSVDPEKTLEIIESLIKTPLVEANSYSLLLAASSLGTDSSKRMLAKQLVKASTIRISENVLDIWENRKSLEDFEVNALAKMVASVEIPAKQKTKASKLLGHFSETIPEVLRKLLVSKKIGHAVAESISEIGIDETYLQELSSSQNESELYAALLALKKLEKLKPSQKDFLLAQMISQSPLLKKAAFSALAVHASEWPKGFVDEMLLGLMASPDRDSRLLAIEAYKDIYAKDLYEKLFHFNYAAYEEMDEVDGQSFGDNLKNSENPIDGLMKFMKISPYTNKELQIALIAGAVNPSNSGFAFVSAFYLDLFESLNNTAFYSLLELEFDHVMKTGALEDAFGLLSTLGHFSFGNAERSKRLIERYNTQDFSDPNNFSDQIYWQMLLGKLGAPGFEALYKDLVVGGFNSDFAFSFQALEKDSRKAAARFLQDKFRKSKLTVERTAILRTLSRMFSPEEKKEVAVEVVAWIGENLEVDNSPPSIKLLSDLKDFLNENQEIAKDVTRKHISKNAHPRVVLSLSRSTPAGSEERTLAKEYILDSIHNYNLSEGLFSFFDVTLNSEERKSFLKALPSKKLHDTSWLRVKRVGDSGLTEAEQSLQYELALAKVRELGVELQSPSSFSGEDASRARQVAQIVSVSGENDIWQSSFPGLVSFFERSDIPKFQKMEVLNSLVKALLMDDFRYDYLEETSALSDRLFELSKQSPNFAELMRDYLEKEFPSKNFIGRVKGRGRFTDFDFIDHEIFKVAMVYPRLGTEGKKIAVDFYEQVIEHAKLSSLVDVLQYMPLLPKSLQAELSQLMARRLELSVGDHWSFQFREQIAKDNPQAILDFVKALDSNKNTSDIRKNILSQLVESVQTRPTGAPSRAELATYLFNHAKSSKFESYHFAGFLINISPFSYELRKELLELALDPLVEPKVQAWALDSIAELFYSQMGSEKEGVKEVSKELLDFKNTHREKFKSLLKKPEVPVTGRLRLFLKEGDD